MLCISVVLDPNTQETNVVDDMLAFFLLQRTSVCLCDFRKKMYFVGGFFFPPKRFSSKRFSRDSLHIQILIFVAVFQKNTDREVGQEREARLLGGSCHKN